MYVLKKDLHVLQCDCCGRVAIVDNEGLIELIYADMVDTDGCDEDCENCELY